MGLYTFYNFGLDMTVDETPKEAWQNNCDFQPLNLLPFSSQEMFPLLTPVCLFPFPFLEPNSLSRFFSFSLPNHGKTNKLPSFLTLQLSGDTKKMGSSFSLHKRLLSYFFSNPCALLWGGFYSQPSSRPHVMARRVKTCRNRL